jgi:excisionase family DNA binding protein
LALIRERSNNLKGFEMADSTNCSVCKDLLANIGWFFDMLETARRSFTSDWLTVDEIAAELKISKSIVYRLIRNGELEAVDLVDTNGKIARKGHYRITRSSLNQFLESKKVRPLPNQVTHPSRSRRLPKVKNHLGL